MNKLQILITEKMSEGKSYRQIERECGVNRVSIHQYHYGMIPTGKNLAMLAKYFKIDFWLLVEKPVKPVKSVKRDNMQTRHEWEVRLFVDEIMKLSPVARARLLLSTRKESEITRSS